MKRPGNSCAGCLTLFVGLFVALILLGLFARYFWILLPVGIAAGFLLYRDRQRKQQRHQQQAEQHVRETAEKIVIRVAAQNQGLVTPMEVALASNLSLEEARDILEQLRKNGHAKLRVADSGSYVYQLDGLLTTQQKKESERL